MIYFEDLWSILECIYLGDKITSKIGEGNVFINPKNIKYLTKRLVIINNPEYSKENIEVLLENECRVISRLKNEDTIFQPYILRINKNCIWNGDTLKEQPKNLNNILENELCTYDLNKNILYFPKIKNPTLISDDYGNLSALGWTLQQIGENIITDTPFKNLDIIKTGKLRT